MKSMPRSRESESQTVARWNPQKECVDHFEIFCPTRSTSSTRLVAVTVLKYVLNIFHLDAERALVHLYFGIGIYTMMQEGCGDLSAKVVWFKKSPCGSSKLDVPGMIC